ncbi:MAG: hypothetical protein ABIK83_03735 [Candidatus Zixiibacteriota bacterium]
MKMIEKSPILSLGGIVFVSAFMLATSLYANQSPMWGNLEPGQYAIGFKTVEEYDYSRTFRTKRDYFGQPREGERARPIQICIWYPAVGAADDMTMVYGEYAFPYPTDDRFMDLVSNYQIRDVQVVGRMAGNNRGLPLDLANVELAAVRDAAPQEGLFPLIVYHPNLETSYCDNVVLCEYLASHGFIAATTHPLGSVRLSPQLNQADLESFTRDMEFVAGYMRHFPNIDPDRLGVIGFGSGGISALLMQMRNSDVDAVVDLGGALTSAPLFKLVKGSASYNPASAKVPLLEMYSDIEHAPDMTLLDSLRYAEKYFCALNGLNHHDFSIGSFVASMTPDSTGAVRLEGVHGYEKICDYVNHFFKAQLTDDAESVEFLKRTPAENGFDAATVSFTYREGGKPLPTELEFTEMLRAGMIAEAVQAYEQIKVSNSGQIPFQEAMLNMVGYQLLGASRVEDALALFKMNAGAFPNSANCWDSYADGALASGDTDLAAKCYRTVLKVLPNDIGTDEQTKEVIRNNAEQFLQGLGDENQE